MVTKQKLREQRHTVETLRQQSILKKRVKSMKVLPALGNARYLLQFLKNDLLRRYCP